jgi:hypothetical protein
MEDRGSTQALKGRARGVIVGSLIAFGWAAYGVSAFREGVRYTILVAAAAFTAGLVAGGIALLRQAGAMPAANSAQMTASKRAWRWFWLNLAGEVVLLNIAINLLRAPDLQKYWIPAISAVVGLHFWPMAYFFRTRSYWYVGAAMMIGAAAAAFLAASYSESAAEIASAEALANAVILWSALGAGLAHGRRTAIKRY